MLVHGVIRRIGVVPNHYRLGLKANGMTVWDVADDQAGLLGEQIARLDFVSHCYLRPRHLPVWRYNLFAMVHGHSRDEVGEKSAQIASLLGSHCNARETLFSSEILKKTGMRLAA
jgi:DNA-binding Lrp family transcriptional regulator